MAHNPSKSSQFLVKGTCHGKSWRHVRYMKEETRSCKTDTQECFDDEYVEYFKQKYSEKCEFWKKQKCVCDTMPCVIHGTRTCLVDDNPWISSDCECVPCDKCFNLYYKLDLDWIAHGYYSFPYHNADCFNSKGGKRNKKSWKHPPRSRKFSRIEEKKLFTRNKNVDF